MYNCWMTAHIEAEIDQVVRSEHSDPFHILGVHPLENTDGRTGLVVRAFLPEAKEAWVVPNDPSTGAVSMDRQRPEGFFTAFFSNQHLPFGHQLRVLDYEGNVKQFIDPYAFPPVLSDFDLHLMGEGSHFQKYEKL